MINEIEQQLKIEEMTDKDVRQWENNFLRNGQ